MGKGLMEFDVDAWRSDEALSLLRPASRDFWHECILCMWKSGQRGELKGSLDDLRRLCRCSLTEARSAIEEIKERNVAEIDERDGLVTLINRRMRRDFENRATVAYRVAKSRAKKAGKPFPFDDVTAFVTRMYQSTDTGSVTRTPASRPAPSPAPPSPTPPNTPAPFAAQTSVGDADGGQPSQRKRKPALEKPIREPAEFRQLTDFWCEQWARHHGGEVYRFLGPDGPIMASLWNCVGFDLAKAKAVIIAYMSAREPIYEGHPTNLFKRDLRKFIARSNPKGNPHVIHKPLPEQRGQFAEPERALPRLVAG